MEEKRKGADLVADAILGSECQTIVVGGEPYFIKPPTIRKIAGLGRALAGCEGDSIRSILDTLTNAEKAAEGLSYLLNGDKSLLDKFLDAPLSEVVNGIAAGMSMVGIEDFQKLSALSKSVRKLIANQK